MNSLKIVFLLFFVTGLQLSAKEFPVCKEYFFIKEGQTKEKQSFLEKILNENPSNVECMLKLSSVYLRENKVSEGFDLIRRAYALDPKFVEKQSISKVLDLALRLSRLKEMAIKTKDSELWNELGDTYYEIGIFDEALKAYESSLKLDPNQTKVDILVALCEGNLDRPFKSASRLKKIVQKEPYDFYANYYLGKVLKNALDNEKEGTKYLLMAEYIVEHENPSFDNENEAKFFRDDLEAELGKK